MILLAVSHTAACSDDGPKDNHGSGGSGAAAGAEGSGNTGNTADAGSPGSAGSTSEGGAPGSALYAVAAEIETPEGDVLYLATVADLGEPFDLLAEGIEIANASTFQAIGEMVFVAPNDAPTITRYVVDENGKLEEDETISFAGVGVTSTREYAIISETKGYVFDYTTYTVHVWNPSAMTLSGVEIDISAAQYDDRGPLWLTPWRFDHVKRDNHLFLSGGWWHDENGPAQVSLVFVFDTEEDTVEILEDDRCTSFGAAKMTRNGDIFFFAHGWGLVANEMAPCALVIRNGETTFDPSYNVDLSTYMDGRIPSDFVQGLGDTLYARVPYAERIEGQTLSDLFYSSGNNGRLWQIDLQAESASEVDAVDFHAGTRWAYATGDDRALLPVYSLIDPEDEAAGYDTQVYELSETSEPVPFAFGDESSEVQARLADIVRLR